MESTTDLREMQEGLRETITSTLEDHSPTDDARGVFVTAHHTGWAHHDLAILDFLLDADAESFFRHMYQSAQCRRYYLLRVIEGLQQSASTLVASVDEFLFDAVASGYPEITEYLSRIMTKRKHPRLDTAERFAYSSLVRLLVDRQEDKPLQAEHERVRQEANREDPRLRSVLAIAAGDQQAFTESFKALLEARQGEIESGAVTRTPDRFIFVEGLALLRIAAQRGLTAVITHPHVPRELLATPSSGPPADGFPELTEAQKTTIRQKVGR